MTTDLLLIRHCRVRWRGAMSDRISGRHDPPLDETGCSQAQRLARRLAMEDRATALYTSPLRRAVETASVVASQLGLEPQVVNTLREWNYQLKAGRWDRLQSLTVTWLYQIGPLRLWLRPLLTYIWHASPALEAFVNRVVDTVTEIAEAYPGQQTVIVAHPGVIRNCSLTRLSADESGLQLLRFNDYSHLSDWLVASPIQIRT